MKNIDELKYPIKYAVMPMKEQIGWYPGLNELEREYGIVAYIVSKCYVVGESKKFLSDGTYKIKYEVVFPYKKDNERVIPEYNFDFQCINSIFVSQLFDSFEEALVVAEQNNKVILNQLIGFLPVDDDFKEKLEEVKVNHQETINKYQVFEQVIENETTDMKVIKTYDSSLDSIIERVIEDPREFFLKIASFLSIAEIEYLKLLIENKSCLNCSNGTCRVETCEKTAFDICVAWYNKELVGRQRLLTLKE